MKHSSLTTKIENKEIHSLVESTPDMGKCHSLIINSDDGVRGSKIVTSFIYITNFNKITELSLHTDTYNKNDLRVVWQNDQWRRHLQRT